MKALNSILVIAAHPDDEILGCGGAIARWAKQGQRVYSLILGEGIMSRYEQSNSGAAKEMSVLHNNSLQAAKVLGVKEVIMESLPDNKFDQVPLLDIVKKIEACIDRLKPQVVYTHHGSDLNVDHRLTLQAVLTATRPMAGTPVKKIYSFETVSATEWSFQQIGAGFRPNVFVDISKTLEKKVQALSFYKSEMRAFPHPRSIKNLRHAAAHWGAVSGCQAAEAFELVRSVE